MKDERISYKAEEDNQIVAWISSYSFERLGPEYKQLWRTMVVTRDQAAHQRLRNLFNRHRDVYRQVEVATGVPAAMVFVIHVREAGESDVGRWRGVLHNGEKIVGTGRKTRLVPAGCGPFATWHAAAVHALRMKGFHLIHDFPPERILWCLEPYNGYGYRRRGLRTPYIWAGTNHQQRGKYVSDGVFNSNVWDTQVGCAPVLRALGVGAQLQPVETPAQPQSAPNQIPTPPGSTTPPVQQQGWGAAIGAYAVSAYHWFQDHWMWFALGAVVLIGLWVFARYRLRRMEQNEGKAIETPQDSPTVLPTVAPVEESAEAVQQPEEDSAEEEKPSEIK